MTPDASRRRATVSVPVAVAILAAVVLGVAYWPVTWWPRESVGARLRRECTTIVREAYPDGREQFLDALLKQCIVRRGEAGR